MNSLQLKRPLFAGGDGSVCGPIWFAHLRSGGAVLFEAEARQAAGDYVPFVVWFNS